MALKNCLDLNEGSESRFLSSAISCAIQMFNNNSNPRLKLLRFRAGALVVRGEQVFASPTLVPPARVIVEHVDSAVFGHTLTRQ